jgi:hypothetical protein
MLVSNVSSTLNFAIRAVRSTSFAIKPDSVRHSCNDIDLEIMRPGFSGRIFVFFETEYTCAWNIHISWKRPHAGPIGPQGMKEIRTIQQLQEPSAQWHQSRWNKSVAVVVGKPNDISPESLTAFLWKLEKQLSSSNGQMAA